jgi:hypothetical protein
VGGALLPLGAEEDMALVDGVAEQNLGCPREGESGEKEGGEGMLCSKTDLARVEERSRCVGRAMSGMRKGWW